MRKRLLIVSIFILIIFISIIVLNDYNNTNKIFKKDGIIYALTLDGVSTNSFPSKGMYRVDVSCENAAGKWDYDNWKLYIEDITNNVSCDIDFTTISKTYLNNKIIGLSGQTQGTGQVVNEKGYRYEGKNPNNYIWFNNELWRIIGVFDEDSHGVSGQNLVKIIREESIGGLAFDKSNTNDWSASSLKSLLNGAYYDWESNKGSASTYCYGYSTVPGNCDYSVIGINDVYRPMVQNVTWYLGGYSSTSATAESFYNYERGTTVPSGNQTETTGYIGLMYVSDFGYSVLASSCARTTNLGPYNNSSCTGQSWLYKTGDEWTITPSSSDSDYVFYLDNGGYLSSSYAHHGYPIRPVLYLKSNVYVVDGNGSIGDPYIIGM